MVFVSIMTLFALGLAASIILAVASRVFYVKEDPRVEAVVEALPGANCGGCGFAGCEGYATAVVNDPSVPANKCCAGGAATSIAVGELTGKTVAEAEPLYALRRCDKLAGKVAPRYQYQGMPSCAAAALMRGGTDVCVYSCLGFGDCVQVCPFGAMEVRDGLVRVDRSKCTGCGVCVAACPRGILELTPQRGRVAVYCNTRDKLRAVMDVCDVGCIKCGKCIKTCPAKAVRLEDNRIVIDHLLCLSYGPICEEACVGTCPRHILRSTRHFLRAALLSGGALTAATLTPALLPLAARAGGLLPGGAPAEPLQQTSLFMGTMVSISVAQVEPGRAEEGMARAFALGRRMADVFTRFDASSPVGALNADGALSDAPPELNALLTRHARGPPDGRRL